MKVLFTEFFADETKSGTKLKTCVYQTSGTYPIIDQGQDFIAGYTDSENGLYTDVPAIIFGDHTRVLKYVDFPFFLGADGAKILKARTNHANYKYLYYALKSIRIPDTGYNRHFKWLKEATVSIPDSRKQEAIVSTLDSISRIISHRKSQLSKLDELVKCRFVELFGDPVTNTKQYKIDTLESIASYWNGLTYSPDDVVEEGTLVLRSSNIQNSVLDFKDTVRVNCRITAKKYVQENDILMCSRNGSAKLVGKVALIHGIKEPMAFGAFMMIIRSSLYYPYLLTYFQTPAFRLQIATGATTTINQITGNMLDKVKLPIPPVSEVEEFSTFVSRVDKLRFVDYVGGEQFNQSLSPQVFLSASFLELLEQILAIILAQGATPRLRPLRQAPPCSKSKSHRPRGAEGASVYKFILSSP